MVIGSVAVGVCLTSASPARALSSLNVTVDGTNYTITTTTTTYSNSTTLLQSQPWWNSASLAQSFATAVDTSFGTPNFSNFGPLFA